MLENYFVKALYWDYVGERELAMRYLVGAQVWADVRQRSAKLRS